MLIFSLLLLFLSVILHELAHGYAAKRLGDPTAEMAGRLSLNPLVHVDPVGTVLLPMLTFFGGGFIFGWAKPVPVNPAYFKDPRRDYVTVALAGPALNAMLLFISILALHALRAFFPDPSTTISLYRDIIAVFAQTNLLLGFFNLLPIPPLDGSRILYLLSPELAHRLEAWGPFLVLFFFMFLSGPFYLLVSRLSRILIPSIP